MRALRKAWAGGATRALDYPDARGLDAARITLSAYLNRSRAAVSSPTRIVMCTGFAQAARLVGEALFARGIRRLAVEDPGQAEQCADFRATGLELCPVPVDDKGLQVERLTRSNCDAVLVTPAHQFPTGAVLDPARRAALVDWASGKGRYIIEDDYDAEYRYDHAPIGALQGLSPERVIYIGSASKILAPSLRMGWLVFPLELSEAIASAKLSADRGSPALEQLTLAEFLTAGDLDRHLRRTRRVYAHRRDVLVRALRKWVPAENIRGAAAGIHLFVDLPRGVDESALLAATNEAGVRVSPASAYYARRDRSRPGALVLGYGGIHEDDIEAGVRRLAELSRRLA
jgi:GntR family transcriptional regulator/MocR family aminotransferase